jgi:hypothetical protein
VRKFKVKQVKTFIFAANWKGSDGFKAPFAHIAGFEYWKSLTNK